MGDRSGVAMAAGCAAAVSDADVDAIAYACLVAVMAQGPNAHVGSEETIAKAAEDNGHPAAVTSSAGALVRTLQEMGAEYEQELHELSESVIE